MASPGYQDLGEKRGYGEQRQEHILDLPRTASGCLPGNCWAGNPQGGASNSQGSDSWCGTWVRLLAYLRGSHSPSRKTGSSSPFRGD